MSELCRSWWDSVIGNFLLNNYLTFKLFAPPVLVSKEIISALFKAVNEKYVSKGLASIVRKKFS